MPPKKIAIYYWAITISHLLFEAIIHTNPQAMMAAMITKTLAMPLLMWYHYVACGKKLDVAQKLIWLGFLFSWSGDINLMLPRVESLKPHADLLFLAGLVSFLITHVLYMLAFAKGTAGNSQPSIVKTKPWIMLPIWLAYGALLAVLAPAINATEPHMLVPVVVYATVITFMVIFALNRQGKVPRASFAAVLVGALVFMASDSVIAINKFHTPFDESRVIIMATYLSAQFLIAWGTTPKAIERA